MESGKFTNAPMCFFFKSWERIINSNHDLSFLINYTICYTPFIIRFIKYKINKYNSYSCHHCFFSTIRSVWFVIYTLVHSFHLYQILSQSQTQIKHVTPVVVSLHPSVVEALMSIYSLLSDLMSGSFQNSRLIHLLEYHRKLLWEPFYHLPVWYSLQTYTDAHEIMKY